MYTTQSFYRDSVYKGEGLIIEIYTTQNIMSCSISSSADSPGKHANN